ncbi:uncharacterized protein LOC100375845 [Saccoglossus kowalevskii]|uniref:Uncharacterized protein LOC100375845 n=1 Tax=Saccoglossus kowalevskii TaxID=10224 RepID=A0ABM0MVS1_SACKO|nr:PREDICTED: uncharacterized protein LOC100375845 [Saccoglossus kowalevskii]
MEFLQLYAVVIIALATSSAVWVPSTEADHMKLVRWSDAAMDFIQKQDCTNMLISSESECEKLKKIPASQMNFYSTSFGNTEQYRSVLPDEGLSRGGEHDVVLALDPYPRANFGHLVVVFYVDLERAPTRCSGLDSFYLGDGECLQLALKNRCHNALHRSIERVNFRKRCEINYLPLVNLKNDDTKVQKLECSNDVTGFAPCPTIHRTDLETNDLMDCELTSNSRRCIGGNLQQVRSHCKIWEICDQAILISGGWSSQTMRPWSEGNTRLMYNMLRNEGFKKQRITTFYADGIMDDHQPEDTDELTSNNFYPASQKIPIRNLITGFCKSPRCVDTLVIYLNNPMTSDGNMLLWDTNGNGVADESETYSVRELMSDLEDCATSHVYLIADMSFAGAIIDELSDSQQHGNVAVYVSSENNQYSWSGEYTNYLTGLDHTRQCMGKIVKDNSRPSMMSSPAFWEGAPNSANTTIYGAPCHFARFFTTRELRREYMGCQNLPTAMWFIKFAQVDSR